MPEGGPRGGRAETLAGCRGGSSSPSPSSGLCCAGVRVRGGQGTWPRPRYVRVSAEVGEQGAGERLSRGEGSAEPPARRRSRKQLSGKGWGVLRGCPSTCSAPVPKPAGSTGLGQQACKDSEWAGGELMDEDGPAPKATRVPCHGVPEVFWGPSAVLGTLRCHGDPAVLWHCCARTPTGSSTRSWRNAWGTLREKERAPRSQGHFKGLQEKPRGSRLCLLPLRGHAAAGRSAVMLHGQHPAHIEVHGMFWGAKTCWGAGAGCPPGRIQALAPFWGQAGKKRQVGATLGAGLGSSPGLSADDAERRLPRRAFV